MPSKRAGRPQPRARRDAGSNPLLEPWSTPFAMPPFDRLRPEHFLPAFGRGLAVNRREIAAIAANPAAPTFANTIEALERAGESLRRVSAVFFNFSATDSSEEIRAIERAMAPRLARHHTRIYQNAELFQRVAAIMHPRRKRALSGEQRRVLEGYHRAFVRAGAALDAKAKKRMAAIAARSSVLATRFSQNLLA